MLRYTRIAQHLVTGLITIVCAFGCASTVPIPELPTTSPNVGFYKPYHLAAVLLMPRDKSGLLIRPEFQNRLLRDYIPYVDIGSIIASTGLEELQRVFSYVAVTADPNIAAQFDVQIVPVLGKIVSGQNGTYSEATMFSDITLQVQVIHRGRELLSDSYRYLGKRYFTRAEGEGPGFISRAIWDSAKSSIRTSFGAAANDWGTKGSVSDFKFIESESILKDDSSSRALTTLVTSDASARSYLDGSGLEKTMRSGSELASESLANSQAQAQAMQALLQANARLQSAAKGLASSPSGVVPIGAVQAADSAKCMSVNQRNNIDYCCDSRAPVDSIYIPGATAGDNDARLAQWISIHCRLKRSDEAFPSER